MADLDLRLYLLFRVNEGHIIKEDCIALAALLTPLARSLERVVGFSMGTGPNRKCCSRLSLRKYKTDMFKSQDV